MTTNVRTVPPDMRLADLQRFLISARISGAPVVAHGKLVGVVSRSDVVRRFVVELTRAEYAADGHAEPGSWHYMPDGEVNEWVGDEVADQLEHLCVDDVMVANVVKVSPETSIEDLAKTMIQRRIHRVLVTEGDSVLGIVSSTDLVRLFAEGRAKV